MYALLAVIRQCVPSGTTYMCVLSSTSHVARLSARIGACNLAEHAIIMDQVKSQTFRARH